MVWLQPYVVTPDDDNDLYMLYVDFLKAYDTVIRRILYYVLREKYGIPDNIVDLIIELHEDLEITPRVRGYVWKWFSVGVGLQQGGVLSPNLWNLLLNHIIVVWRKELGKNRWGVPIYHCRDGRIRDVRKIFDVVSIPGIRRRCHAITKREIQIRQDGTDIFRSH